MIIKLTEVDIYPFLRDAEIVRVAMELYQAKMESSWEGWNQVTLHKAPDGRVKVVELAQKTQQRRKVRT